MDAAARTRATNPGAEAQPLRVLPAADKLRVSWVVARLGGWNCYYRPPGPKTMADGWQRLAAMRDGFELAEAMRDV